MSFKYKTLSLVKELGKEEAPIALSFLEGEDNMKRIRVFRTRIVEQMLRKKLALARCMTQLVNRNSINGEL